MEELKQNKAEPHLDILVRPTPFLLFVKILVIHGILLVIAGIFLSLPQMFGSNANQAVLYNVGVGALLTAMLVGEIVTLVTLAQWVTEFYVIKSDSLTYRAGVFVKRKRVLMMTRVVEVYMAQNFFGRLLNYGTLTLISTQETEGVLMRQIESPGKYFKILRELTIAHADRKKGQLEQHLGQADAINIEMKPNKEQAPATTKQEEPAEV